MASFLDDARCFSGGSPPLQRRLCPVVETGGVSRIRGLGWILGESPLLSVTHATEPALEASPLDRVEPEQATVLPAGALVALLPAHDEEAALPAALASLAAQTRRADRVVVVADNCTDRTEDVARAGGA
jgi:hypothetical protein